MLLKAFFSILNSQVSASSANNSCAKRPNKHSLQLCWDIYTPNPKIFPVS